MGNDCFSLIRCFLFQSFLRVQRYRLLSEPAIPKNDDFGRNMALSSSDFPTYLFFK